MIISIKMLKKYWCLLMLSFLLLTMLFAIYFIAIGQSFNLEDSLAYEINEKELLPCARYFKQKEPRILCTIFTVKEAHKTKMKAIHQTWSKRCPYSLYLYLSLKGYSFFCWITILMNCNLPWPERLLNPFWINIF